MTSLRDADGRDMEAGSGESEMSTLVEGSDPKADTLGRSSSGKSEEEPPPKAVSASPASEESGWLNMKTVALVSLTTVQTIGPLQTAWTRRQNIASGGPRYLNCAIIIFGECVKVICSFVLLCMEEKGVANAAKSVHRQITGNLADSAKITVPALLYAVQGNLLFYSMDKLSPPVFTVTYQLKILTTALLSVVLLGKKIGFVKWIALVLLTVGVALVQLQDTPKAKPSATATTPAPADDGLMSNAVKGFIAVIAACCTSGLAGVYLEKMLTQTAASIWMRNVQLGLIGAIMASCTAFVKDWDKIAEGGLAQGFTGYTFALVCTHACGGLCSAAVLKYAGNILKCFAAAISVVLVSIIAVYMTGFYPGILFEAGVVFVIISVFLYNVGCPTVVDECMQKFSQDPWKAIDQNIVPQSNTAGGSHTK